MNKQHVGSRVFGAYFFGKIDEIQCPFFIACWNSILINTLPGVHSTFQWLFSFYIMKFSPFLCFWNPYKDTILRITFAFVTCSVSRYFDKPINLFFNENKWNRKPEVHLREPFRKTACWENIGPSLFTCSKPYQDCVYRFWKACNVRVKMRASFKDIKRYFLSPPLDGTIFHAAALVFEQCTFLRSYLHKSFPGSLVFMQNDHSIFSVLLLPLKKNCLEGYFPVNIGKYGKHRIAMTSSVLSQKLCFPHFQRSVIPMEAIGTTVTPGQGFLLPFTYRHTDKFLALKVWICHSKLTCKGCS